MGFRPFSWGNFGCVPDPPEPWECNGVFDENICSLCSDYEKCKDAEYIDDWEKLANEDDE